MGDEKVCLHHTQERPCQPVTLDTTGASLAVVPGGRTGGRRHGQGRLEKMG